MSSRLTSSALRWLGPATVAVAGVAVALGCLLVRSGDPTYSCARRPVLDLVHPEPEQSTRFRRNFFDVGYECNQDARVRAAVAIAVLIIAGTTAWFWRRRMTRLEAAA